MAATPRSRRPYAPRVPMAQRREQLMDAALRVIARDGYPGVEVAMRHLLRAEVMLPPMPALIRPASSVITWFLRRGTLALMPRWMRELVGLPTGRLVDAAVAPVLKISFRVIDSSVRLKLILLRILSPATLPLGARVLLGVSPSTPVTMTPREAQERYGYQPPAAAHLEFRRRQHQRVFQDGDRPSDDGLIESQAILGDLT